MVKIFAQFGFVMKIGERETRVDSWEIAENLLKAMGFNEITSYEKNRISFEYDGVKLNKE